MAPSVTVQAGKGLGTPKSTYKIYVHSTRPYSDFKIFPCVKIFNEKRRFSVCAGQ